MPGAGGPSQGPDPLLPSGPTIWQERLTHEQGPWGVGEEVGRGDLTSSACPFSWDLDERSNRERGTRPHQEVPSPCRKLCYIPLTGNPLQHPPGLWRSELTAESERYLQGEKGNRK